MYNNYKLNHMLILQLQKLLSNVYQLQTDQVLSITKKEFLTHGENY